MAAFMALLVIFSSSCKEDDPILPDYAGTWVALVNIPTEAGIMSLKETITLTETGYSDLAQMQVDKWTDLASMKGSMMVSGNFLNITLTQVGMSSMNMLTGFPDGVIITYEATDPGFNALLTDLGQTKTFKFEYSISGNLMTLRTDKNEDGDTLDENETTVYTKQ
jgi:hypothetical protein